MSGSVAVVGGGIAGLVAALRLAETYDVTVFEAGDVLGGKIATGELAGERVELGPDMFLDRVPWAVELCGELGLADELVAPDTSAAAVFSRGRLRRLPDGLALGIPTDLAAVARAGILSPAGLARASLDLVLPATSLGDDPAVGELVTRRFGRQVTERLVGPLLGGINAGDIDRLSLASSAPQLAGPARSHRSLLLGLRAARVATTGSSTGSPFRSVRGGLGRLVETLGERLGSVDVRLGARVETVGPSTAAHGVKVRSDAGDERYDAAVVAVPAHAAATVLDADRLGEAARLVGQIPYASVAVALVAFEPDQVGHPLDGSGFVVPREHGLLTTACTWYSSKWASQLSGDRVILRISAGRFGDDRPAGLTDVDLLARLLAEIGPILGVTGAPVTTQVVRWDRSFPQYVPGHQALVERATATLATATPLIALAGAAYGGVGLPACIRSGDEAAGAVRDALR